MDVLLAALVEFFEPFRLLMLFSGVVLGLLIGVIPGLGGVFGLTILVPITYGLDPYAAFALLIGMGSVTTTSDTIPAVLLGVPGTVGAAATVLDGHELAKQGKAAEALGAAYTASLMGGVFGALVLAASLPIMRKVVLFLNYGDLLAITIFGLTLVAMLSGNSRRRGLLMAMFGVLISLVGLDPYEGAERWTFGQYYLWSGVPTGIFFLGVFAVPELAALLSRGQIQRETSMTSVGGLRRGVFSSLREWRLILKSSSLGALLGAVPGVGVTVIEWIAYGNASRKPGNGPAFGQGNIRGVIGPESANNAKEGGALLPTLAFGIPGSATMAILLGAFSIHGIVPGPRMLEAEAPLLVSLVFTVAAANIIGAGICLGLTPTLARVSMIPARIIAPATLIFVVLGAFYTHRQPLDLFFLGLFGLLGIVMRQLGWSRPALALGFVLGPNLERFFVLSYQISGWSWLGQPVVLAIFALVLANVLRHAKGWQTGRVFGPGRNGQPSGMIGSAQDRAMAAGISLIGIVGMIFLMELPKAARIFPLMAVIASLLCVITILLQRRPELSEKGPNWTGQTKLLLLLLGAVVSVLALGHILGAAFFAVVAVIALGERRWLPIAAVCLGVLGGAYLVFNVLGYATWPEPWIHLNRG